MIAAREVVVAEQPERSVVSRFVRRQQEEMERGRSKEQAYRLAEQWLIDNGRDALRLMQIFPQERSDWARPRCLCLCVLLRSRLPLTLCCAV